MKILSLIAFMAITLCSQALANGPWDVKFQDLKLPSQSQLEQKKWSNPLVGASTVILNAQAVPGSSTYVSFAAQPDYPRNLVLTPGGSTSNITSGNVTVSGLNIYGKSISEAFAFSNGQSSAVTGSKAFASVSSISFPSASGSNITLTAKAGDKLGVHRCADDNGDYVFSKFGGAYETSRGTFSSNATAIESNVFTPNGTMDGAHNVSIRFIQNFRCYPN